MASNDEVSEEHKNIFKPMWILGITASLLCFILQTLMLIMLPKTRKLDQKIIIQLTLARVVYSITEYTVNYGPKMPDILVFLLFTVYHQIDLVLVCWMCVFTKNLYNKIVIAFTSQKNYYIAYTVVIWTSTFFIGTLAPILLNYGYYYGHDYYKIFYKVCGFAKLCVVCYNVWLLYKIYSVFAVKFTTREIHVKDLVKTCVVAFIITTISFLQVLVTDLLSFFDGYDEVIVNTFSTINSFQAIAFTVIFLILVKDARTESY